ncbi:MAG TPA: flagellar basal body P-ring protein FlgI [Polyangia bacterium]
MRALFNRKVLIALWVTVVALAATGARPVFGAPVRVKELADIQGVRENALYGYGLVVGLAGTGDSERVFFTSQSISGMLGRLGIRIDPRDVRVRNVAAVMVTARLPSFSRPGTRIDVSVSSMGNARSLAGGVLLVTPLTGPDGNVYALAQGPVQAGGYDIAAGGARMQKNQPTSGSVPGGAAVERSVTPNLEGKPLLLGLRRPDFTTANRIAAAINKSLNEEVASALDPAGIEVKVPAAFKGKAVSLIAQIEALEVDPDQRARIAVSERTGTVVAGQGVRIREVAVAHGGISIAVSQTPFVSQPGPLAAGKTIAGKQTSVEAKETAKPVVGLPATTTIDDLVKALNLLGVGARDLVAILQAMKAAGAIDAELEVL